MKSIKPTPPNRWFLLALGFMCSLMTGIEYAWSILKMPLGDTFGWSAAQLAMIYSGMMALFSLGLLEGGLLLKRLPTRAVILLGGCMTASGLILTSFQTGNFPLAVLSMSLLTGAGIGITYNTVFSAVNAWFPDKKGLSSGIQMMGLGFSALILGNLAAFLFDLQGIGWRRTYLFLGIVIATVIAIAAGFVRFPREDEIAELPVTYKGDDTHSQDVEPRLMVRTPKFILYFLYVVAVSAIGQSVFSFAKDVSLFVGTTAALANLLVAAMAISNGLGRVFFGLLFDRFGLSRTLLVANFVTLGAVISTLITVRSLQIPLLTIGLILTALSFSSATTLTSTFVSSQFGYRHFPVNFSIVSLSGILSALSATLFNGLYVQSGTFVTPYIGLVGLAFFAFSIFLVLRKQLSN